MPCSLLLEAGRGGQSSFNSSTIWLDGSKNFDAIYFSLKPPQIIARVWYVLFCDRHDLPNHNLTKTNSKTHGHSWSARRVDERRVVRERAACAASGASEVEALIASWTADSAARNHDFSRSSVRAIQS